MGFFQILGKGSSVAYHLDLLPSFSIYPVLYISYIKKHKQPIVLLKAATPIYFSWKGRCII